MLMGRSCWLMGGCLLICSEQTGMNEVKCTVCMRRLEGWEGLVWHQDSSAVYLRKHNGVVASKCSVSQGLRNGSIKRVTKSIKSEQKVQ